MKQRVFVAPAIAGVLLFLGVSLSLAQSPHRHEHPRAVTTGRTAADAPPWFIDVIDGDASTDVGQYVSVAIDPRNDRPYVSYYDATNGDLRVAKYVESGGNCGPGGTWWCETVDSPGDVGKFSSIDIYTGTSPFTWKVGVSYYDADNHALKYAQYAWVQFLQSYEWSTYGIQSGSGVTRYGQHTSCKFDETGSPHISYHRSVPVLSSNDALMYAHRVSSGGNCGPSGTWECSALDTGNGVGRYTSMILPSDVMIAYIDAGGGRLRVSKEGSNTTIDDYGEILYASAGWDSVNRRAHIAYYDEDRGVLRYAYEDTLGTCGGWEWECYTAATMGTSPHPMGISVVGDASSFPLFAYQDASGGPGSETLKVTDGGTPETIDPGGVCTDEGRFVSFDISPSGLAAIAYYENNTCVGTGRLKVAHYPFHEVLLPLVLRDK